MSPAKIGVLTVSERGSVVSGESIGEVGNQIRASLGRLPFAALNHADGLLEQASALIAEASGGESEELEAVRVQYSYARQQLSQIQSLLAEATKLYDGYLTQLGLPASTVVSPAKDGNPPADGNAAEQAAQTSTGHWAAVHPLRTADCPRVDDITVPDLRRIHILDGDGDGRSGGHLHGTGIPGKSEFPAHWDDAKVIKEIMDVACRPDSPPRWQDFGTWLVRGTRDRVRIAVVVSPGGEIITGYPEGGEGVTRNPRKRGKHTHGL